MTTETLSNFLLIWFLCSLALVDNFLLVCSTYVTSQFWHSKQYTTFLLLSWARGFLRTFMTLFNLLGLRNAKKIFLFLRKDDRKQEISFINGKEKNSRSDIDCKNCDSVELSFCSKNFIRLFMTLKMSKG